MQSASTANVTAVTSPEQLLAAVKRGDEHIEIQAHLDLTSIPPLDNSGAYPIILGFVEKSVKSIRVRFNLSPYSFMYFLIRVRCNLSPEYPQRHQHLPLATSH